MKLEGLIAAMTDIVKLGKDSSAADLRRACVAGCRELTAMADDDAFLELLGKSSPADVVDPDVRRILTDLASFGAFLGAEVHALVKSGVDRETSEVLLDQVARLRQRIATIRAEPDTLKGGIHELRDEVCELVPLFDDPSSDHDRQRRVKDVLKRVGWGIGGAAIFQINAASGWVTGPYALASMTFGSGLVSYAIRGR
jgi:hypothetical protein